MPSPHLVSIFNDTAKTILFAFGWIIVATLYSTSQILKWAHMQEITIEQVKKRNCIIRSVAGLMIAYIVLSESLMYYVWDPWGIEYYAISDSICFTGLALTYAIVVCYLLKNLTRIQIVDGTLDKEKDEILHQFYVFELVFFTRALFSVGTYFLYTPQ